jgi:hypothetical protein
MVADSFTADDLLHEARQVLREPRSHPWLRSLIVDGLLDSPELHGVQGRRGGREPGTWPASQYALFEELLDAMRRGAKRPELCNIIVARWIVAGSDHIPARQVRRALRTYRDAAWQRRRTRRVGLQLAELFEAEPETMSRSMRKRFADAFESAVHDGNVDRDQLSSKAFADWIAPTALGKGLGPQGLIIGLEALASGSAALDTASDETMEECGRLCLNAMNLFAGLLARDDTLRELLHTYPGSTLEENACALVIATLGLVSKFSDNPTPDKSAPRPRERPGAMARGGTAPHAGQHASARKRRDAASRSVPLDRSGA